jgi:nickel superoxide dismutase
MVRKTLMLLALTAIVAAPNSRALAHCQIPCGIYNDPVRFALLEEHVATIEKSMKQIQTLSEEQQPNWNQIVRWVNNKETHADEFTEIVTFYFMAQRVKPADPKDQAAHAKYVREIALLHQMVFYAMKTKQTTDLEHCARLRALIKHFRASYLGEPSRDAGSAAHEHKQP